MSELLQTGTTSVPDLGTAVDLARVLIIAACAGVLGALYPALRAWWLTPMEART